MNRDEGMALEQDVMNVLVGKFREYIKKGYSVREINEYTEVI